MISRLVSEAPFLLAGGLVASGMAYLFATNAVGAAWTLVAVVTVTAAVVPAYELDLSQAGITIHALDVIAGLMFAIGLVRLVSRPDPASVAFPVAILAAMLLVHVVWGALTFDLQTAINGTRSWLYLLGPLVFALQASPRWTKRSFLPLIGGAVAMSCFALVQIGRNGLYGANEYIEIGGELVDARPVTAAGALLIVQCILIAASGGFVQSTRWWLSISAMGGTALLLQHRTVWAVALLAVAIAYVRWARVAIFTNARAALGAASAIMLVVPMVVALALSSSAFADSIDTATGRNSTLEWRTESWGDLIESHRSPQDLLAGLPAGSSLERAIGDVVVTQSPHSLYVDALLAFGVGGALLLIWLGALVVRRRRDVAKALEISSVVVALIVLSDAIFGITNMLGPLQGLLFGMLLQAASRANTEDLPL